MSNFICIGPATPEELAAYKEYKFQLWLAALKDPGKQERKEVQTVVTVKHITAGRCPSCGHCLMYPVDTQCDECYQKVKWPEKRDDNVLAN